MRVVVAGIGCRKGADVGAVLGAVDAALVAASLSRAALRALATSEAKAAEPGVREAARSLFLPLLTAPHAALRRAEPRTITRSAASTAATGLGSLSEAAALAAAGAGGKLLGPRIAVGPATCALAEGAAS
ncbi:MAG TPA: cobalamin biosynthesis protein [Mesorhizobium sp.]|nr:cobalamin biosynthesis protein [Mesorhizobium sp.]